MNLFTFRTICQCDFFIAMCKYKGLWFLIEYGIGNNRSQVEMWQTMIETP